VTNLAYTDDTITDVAKIGVLAASSIAAGFGAVLLAMSSPRPGRAVRRSRVGVGAEDPGARDQSVPA